MGDMIESGTLPPGSGGADEAADALDGALGGLERKVPGGGAGLGPGGPFAAKRKLSAKDGTDVGGADVGGFGLLPGGRLSGAGRADIKGSGLQNKSPIMKPPAPVSDAQFDADLNGAVEFYRGISPRNLKDNRNGTIPDIEGKLEEHFSGMMEYYFEAVDPEGGPEEAAEWAFDEIKGRLPAALGKAGEKVLNIPSGDKTVSEYILKNLDEHFEANGGMDRLEEIAAGTDGYKRGLGKAENGLSAFTKRPEGDDRSAKEILEDNPILANLDPDDMERLGERVGGDPSKDADAAFLAASVLNRVERYTNDGKRITDSGGDAGNGKVDGYWLKGWSDKRKAKEGTEAARLEEFLEEGFSVFEGEDVPLDGRPPGGVAASGLSETTKRPPGDDRSAKEIKDDHPVLDELSGAEAKQLKFWFGDFDKNADAAYRAAAAIENVKRYDADGKPIYNEDVTSDKIEKGDERDRFERLLDEGPGALKGDGSWSDYHVTEKTEYDGDKSAKDILEDNSTWNALATPQRRALLELEPDLHTDPDAAHRATRALNHIQVWDKDGNSQAVTDDHRLKGFKSKVRDKDAKHDPTDPLNDNGIDWAVSSHSGTKARQFEDLIREGYGSLKGGPEANLNKEIAGAANTPFEAFKDAALRGDLDAMRDAMRDPDFDIDATADNGVGLIHVAAFADDPLQTVELLVEGGVDVAKLHEGANTLDTLEAKGHHDAADYLQDVLNSYLRQAVRDGNPGRAAELMAGGADPGAAANPNAKAGGGVSVLELAAVHDPEMARAMLEAMPEAERADVLNAPSADGNIAMHAIAASGDAELYEDAKDWGGDADVANRAGHTAEDVHDKVAKAIDEHEEEHGELKKRGLGDVLEFFGFDPSEWPDASLGDIPRLGMSKLFDHMALTRWLEINPFKGDKPPQEELDARLGAAVRIGDAEAVGDLIEAGADPGTEMVEGSGTDMLLYAASQGDLDTVKAIRDAVSDAEWDALVNKQGINGMTPLLAAAFEAAPGEDGTRAPGSADMYNYLLRNGADDGIRDLVFDVSAGEVADGRFDDVADFTDFEDPAGDGSSGNLEKRGVNDNPDLAYALMYRPGRGQVRNWFRSRLDRFRNEPAPPAVSPPATGGGGGPVDPPRTEPAQNGNPPIDLRPQPVEPDVHLVPARGDPDRFNNNMNDFEQEAQTRLRNIQTHLGDDLAMGDNIEVVQQEGPNGTHRLFIRIGNAVIGAIPQNAEFAEYRIPEVGRLTLGQLRRMAREEASNQNPSTAEQQNFILRTLASLETVVQTRAGRDLWVQILSPNPPGGPRNENNRPIFILPGNHNAVRVEMRENPHSVPAQEQLLFLNHDRVLNELSEMRGHPEPWGTRDGGPPHAFMQHEGVHVLQYRDGYLSLDRGEYEGQRADIDGVEVEWTERNGGAWLVPVTEDGDAVPYREMRAVGLWPFSPDVRNPDGSRRYPHTENAMRREMGLPPRTYYGDPNEQGPNGQYGHDDAPWNLPGWVPPPLQPGRPNIWPDDQQPNKP